MNNIKISKMFHTQNLFSISIFSLYFFTLSHVKTRNFLSFVFLKLILRFGIVLMWVESNTEDYTRASMKFIYHDLMLIRAKSPFATAIKVKCFCYRVQVENMFTTRGLENFSYSLKNFLDWQINIFSIVKLEPED